MAATMNMANEAVFSGGYEIRNFRGRDRQRDL